MIIKTERAEYEIVIGIEVHAQLNLDAKLFSQTSINFGDEINENVSFFDIASPGKLPILNKKAVEEAVKIGLSLNAEINPMSIFDRKHYFYPDSPQGYQITQFYEPIVKNGFLEIELPEGGLKKIRITRAHLEQDAGKLMHDLIQGKTVVDYNRVGATLLEIVSEPDIKSPFEASEYIKNLRAILRATGACKGDMEKGEMRCDVNVSVMPLGSKVFGTRCEIKNVNSVRFVAKAIEYEANRQVEEIEAGRKITSETRLFDSALSITKAMRGKENASDYRYIPEPDLKPIYITAEFIEEIKKGLPEMPFSKKIRYQNEFGLSSFEAGLLTLEVETSKYFEELLSLIKDAKLCANWMLGELFAKLNASNLELSSCKVKPSDLGELLSKIKNGDISNTQGKEVFAEMFETGEKATDIIKKKGFVQISGEDAILKIIKEVLANHKEKVEEYKTGKTKLFGFFTGEVMKASKGMVNPAVASKVLKDELERC
jgi:aspartyl-tRNA(Asn)/glutamyl-tRNA(Gln) amidotransferase subunit B